MARWSAGASEVWWSRRTGRHALLPADVADGPALRARLARLDLLDGPAPDPATWYPVRGWLPLVRPDRGEIWYPVPDDHPAGGHPWAARAADPAILRAWHACDGRTPGSRVAERAGIPLEALAGLLAWACDPAVQAGQWRAEPVTRPDPGLGRLVSPPRAPGHAPSGLYDATGATDLKAFHLGISDAATHFDDVETSIAHAHAIPHPGLGGRTYGEALGDRLGWWPEPGLTLEIGPGDGELAAAMRPRADPERWVRLDLSPALLAESARKNPGSPGILADATRLPFAPGSVARAVVNEVVADLTAVPRAALDPRWLAFGLRDEPRAYNAGAFALVAELARVLAPGGTAFVSEFGGADGLADTAPEPTSQLDHPEVSIQFHDLACVARGHGLRVALHRLDELLGFDLTARHLWRPHFAGLRAMFRADGRHLPARAWTADNLPLPWPVEGLRHVPLSEPGPGPLVTRFWALVLEKP